ncbi:MAG TPA: flagellar export chaperone FlgN [Anaeromyxobacteraceae bacterium]|nr:flagellar export chaperone FlgN [Anaeromyxobacteraceae bacterium]
MDLENALETAGRLRDALAAEVESARHERQLLRALDTKGLFSRAAQRSGFLAEVARLEQELAAALGRAARALGVGEVTLEALRARAPGPGGALARTLSEVRALAGALKEIDALNLQLAGRALACVRGYVDALQPTPRAYDRRGGRAAAPALAMVSSKG